MKHTRKIVFATALAMFIALSAAACSSDDSTPTTVPTPTATMPPTPTPLPDDVLIESVRRFLMNEFNIFSVDVDAEGDGRISHNCLEVLEGGPDGFEWSVETRDDGQTVVRLDHSASLVGAKTGTWLAIPGGGVGTTATSLNCNDVPSKAYYRDNPSQ